MKHAGGWVVFVGLVAAPAIAGASPASLSAAEFSRGDWKPAQLPAISSDGTTVALPATWTEDGADRCVSHTVSVVAVGRVKGKDHPLTSDPCALDFDEELASIKEVLPGVNKVLSDGGYRPLPVVAPGEELAPSLTWSSKARKGRVTVSVHLGKRRVGRASAKGRGTPEVVGAVLVRGAAPYIYVRVRWTQTSHSVRTTDRWLAVELSRDRTKEVASEPASSSDPSPTGLTQLAAQGASWPVNLEMTAAFVLEDKTERTEKTATLRVESARQVGAGTVIQLKLDPLPKLSLEDGYELLFLRGDDSSCLALVGNWLYSNVPCKAGAQQLAKLAKTGTAVAGTTAGKHRGATARDKKQRICTSAGDGSEDSYLSTEICLSPATGLQSIRIAHSQYGGEREYSVTATFGAYRAP